MLNNLKVFRQVLDQLVDVEVDYIDKNLYHGILHFFSYIFIFSNFSVILQFSFAVTGYFHLLRPLKVRQIKQSEKQKSLEQLTFNVHTKGITCSP